MRARRILVIFNEETIADETIHLRRAAKKARRAVKKARKAAREALRQEQNSAFARKWRKSFVKPAKKKSKKRGAKKRRRDRMRK